MFAWGVTLQHLCRPLLAAVTVLSAGQLTFAQAPGTSGAGPRPPAPPPAAAPADRTAAAEVLALEQKIEDAVVRGDVAFVDSVTPRDFSFVHGDGWTTGGKPLMSDDKAAFLKRVADKEYLVHDLDSVRVEMHADVAITYGRYVSLYLPRNRNTAAPGRLNSIWFERVYAKREGAWQFLSHRTVHGPTVSPAGVDPSAATAVQNIKP
ncbi:MAG: nuclear transport factor 2 family protein [Acidobacteriota bacterium]